jgi:hypothetical protein
MNNRSGTPLVGTDRQGSPSSDTAAMGVDTNNDGIVDSREKWDAKVDKNRRENAGAPPVFAVLKGGKNDGEADGAAVAPKGAGVEDEGLRAISFRFALVPRTIEESLIRNENLTPEADAVVARFYIQPARERVGDFIAAKLAERGITTVPPSVGGGQGAHGAKGVAA